MWISFWYFSFTLFFVCFVLSGLLWVIIFSHTEIWSALVVLKSAYNQIDWLCAGCRCALCLQMLSCSAHSTDSHAAICGNTEICLHSDWITCQSVFLEHFLSVGFILSSLQPLQDRAEGEWDATVLKWIPKCVTGLTTETPGKETSGEIQQWRASHDCKTTVW